MILKYKTLNLIVQPTNLLYSTVAVFSKVIPFKKTLKMNTLKLEEVRNYLRLKL